MHHHNTSLAPPAPLARCSIPILPVHAMQHRSDAGSSAEAAASSLLVCVEYPGFVQSIPNALKRCKGEDSIRKLLPSSSGPSAVSSVPSDSLLKLYLRPDDPSAAPLFGEVAHDLHRKPHASTTHATVHKEDADTAAGKAAGTTTSESFYEFVVKVTKKKNRAPAHSVAASSSAAAAAASSSNLSAQLMGMISTSVTFPGLCDFQLLHAQRTPIVQMEMPLLTQPLDTHMAAAARAYDPNADPSCFLPNQPGDLYALAPMIFSRYDYAREYGFAHHENTSAAAKSMQATVPFKPKVTPPIRGDESGEEKEGASAAQPSQLSGKKRVRKPAPAAASAASSHAASAAPAVPAVAANDDSEAEGAGAGGEDDEDDDAAAEGGGDDVSEAGEKGGHVKRGRQARRFFITFATPTPAGPTAPELLAPELQSKPLVAQLRALFEHRAICSTDYLLVKIAEDRARALREERKQTGEASPAAGAAAGAAAAPASAELSRSDLLHHLPCVAYRFSGGPWRNLWLRYGFDPRSSTVASEARRLQVVDYRVPRKLFEEIAEKQGQSTAANPGMHAIKRSQPSGGTGVAPMEEDTPTAAAAVAAASRSVSPATSAAPLSVAIFSAAPLPLSQVDLHFDKMPTRLHSKFQLLDVRGEEIQQIVNDSELAPTCDKDRGWYLNASLSSIRRLMTSRMHGWCVEQGLASASLLHTTSSASTKSKHSKRTLGRSFAAASFSVNNPLAATERQFKRSQKTAETKRRKKAAAEAEALATGIPIPVQPRKKRKKKGEAEATAVAGDAASLPGVSPSVAASISASSVRAAAVVARAAEALRAGSSAPALTVPAAAAPRPVSSLAAASRLVFDVAQAAAASNPAAIATAAAAAALSEGEAEEEDEEDDDEDEGMEDE